MKKLLVLASFLGAFSVSGFAQTAARTPAEAGAQLVAERDAAWLKAQPGPAKAQTTTGHTTSKHAKPNKNARQGQHAKKGQHHNQHAKKSHHHKPTAA